MKKYIFLFILVTARCFAEDNEPIPLHVSAKIIEQVQKSFPNNQTAQLVLLHDSINSYKKLRALKRQLPDSIGLLSDIERIYPNQYSDQLAFLENILEKLEREYPEIVLEIKKVLATN